MEAVDLAVWFQSVKGDRVEGSRASPGSEGLGTWAKEVGLELHAHLPPFLIKSWPLKVEGGLRDYLAALHPFLERDPSEQCLKNQH